MKRLALTVLAAVWLLAGCDSAPVIDLEWPDPPSFLVQAAHGKVGIRRIEFRDEQARVIWRIVPVRPIEHETFRFTYGEVPEGYVQSVPAFARPPVRLEMLRRSALIVYATSFTGPLCLETSSGHVKVDESTAVWELPYSQP